MGIFDDDFYLDEDQDEVAECVECGRLGDGIYTSMYKDKSGNYICERCME